MLRVFSPLEITLDLLIFVAFVVAWRVPLLGTRIMNAAERLGERLARRKGLAILVIAVAPIAIRLSLLWLMPPPVPAIHDEFSYLLAADTFVERRLANPPHPMWIFFDTLHVNQHPTYASMFPPAQGAVLALGQRLGHPWIGVLLSVSAMCAAILWMLQGWFPPHWAMLGSTLVLLRLALFSYWMNSYWGGAVAAVGGALVMGALPRILHGPRSAHALLMGLGAFILANSRPLEGLLLCLPVAVVLIRWLWKQRALSRRQILKCLLLPLTGMMISTVFCVSYYNYRVTGSAFLFPHTLNERTYISTPFFIWQSPRPPLHYTSPQLEFYYNGWVRPTWFRTRFHLERHAAKIFYFFLWPELSVPLLALPWLLCDGRIRILIWQFAFCFLGLLAVAWSLPHYAAPLTATLFAVLVQGMRHLRRWRSGGRPVGIGLSRVVVTFSVLMICVYIVEAFKNPHAASFVAPEGVWSAPGNVSRARIEAQLEAMPGKHLVIVRYTPREDLSEWVYNRADIDHSKVVWAREIPGTDLRPLLNYFRARRAWLVEPDRSPPRITPY
jgi:hypothetical protein